MTVNKEELKKSRMYARQQLIDGWDQEIVSEGCIMIVGVGALGCEIAKDFALMGIGKVVLVDLDTIETSNLSRQMLFKPGDEGRPKAEVAAERLKDMNPFLKVDFYFEKLQKLPMSVYEECDIVIAALDNFNARLDLNKICLRLKKPMVEGGTVGFEGHVQVVIPEDSGFEYKNRETEIEKIIESRMWEFDNPEYLDAQKEIEQLEYLIERLKIEKLEPFRKLVRKQVETEFDKKYAKDLLDITPCYRCLVPIPPADDKLVAACTLKGLPRNRNHCVIKAEVIFEMDADFSHDPQMIPIMLRALEDADLIVGSRKVGTGRVYGWGVKRRMVSWGANALTHLLLGLKTHDVTSGFRAIRADVIKKIDLDKMKTEGYAFQLEFLYLVERVVGGTVLEVPISFADRVKGHSKLGISDILEFGVQVLRLFLRRPMKKSYI